MKILCVSEPRKLRRFFGLALCAAILLDTAHAQPPKRKNGSPTPSPSPSPANSLTSDELAFIQNAWTANAAKLKLANLALQNTQSKTVRDFANRQLQEHAKAYNDLKNIAKLYDVRLLPEAADAQEAYRQLSQTHGPEFDRAYLSMAVELYASELAAEKKMQGSAKNGEVKKFVDADIPRIESRLQAARETLTSQGDAKK